MSDSVFTFIHYTLPQAAAARWPHMPLPRDDLDLDPQTAAAFGSADASRPPKWADLALDRFSQPADGPQNDATILQRPQLPLPPARTAEGSSEEHFQRFLGTTR